MNLGKILPFSCSRNSIAVTFSKRKHIIKGFSGFRGDDSTLLGGKKKLFCKPRFKKKKIFFYFKQLFVMVSHLSVRKSWHEMLAELFTAVDLLTKQVLDCRIGLLEMCLHEF